MAKVDYTIEEHKHRFAAWAASRAASTSSNCRFSVSKGKELLEHINLQSLLCDPDKLPSPKEFDLKHQEWRRSLVEKAIKTDLIGFTHGIAAKLINIYLKSAFICVYDQNLPIIKAIHPPIDRLLLNELARNNIGNFGTRWACFRNIGWSNFTSNDYEEVIHYIKQVTNDSLWTIEKYWPGNQ